MRELLGHAAREAKPVIASEIRIYLLSHALTVATGLASVLMAFRLLESRRTSQSTLAWLLALVFIPFVAIPLYLTLGQRKFPKHAKGPSRDRPRSAAPDALTPKVSFASVLRSSGVAPPRSGHAFELLTTGEAAYARLLQLIRGAERSIDLTMFILGNDATGRAFVDALAERAKRGVAVRVVLDAVGSARARGHATRVLHAAGAQVRAFMPLRHSPVRGRTNLRSHRKLCIIDGKHVFTGGMNLASEYMGPPPAPTDPPRWRDVAAITTGPAAADAEALFESDWTFCGGPRREPSAPLAAASGEAVVQIVPSGPDMPTDTIYDLFLTGIFAAQERVAIVTPYYVPDELLQRALILAARRGVRTELVLPARSNHSIADMARRKLLRDLHDAGVVAHYYTLGMIHAKAMLIDDAFAYVGSPNFDMRSLFLNYENALCVYSPDAIAQIRGFVDGLIAQCDPAWLPARELWFAEQVARLLAPEL
jgi:cardiolipin synthase